VNISLIPKPVENLLSTLIKSLSIPPLWKGGNNEFFPLAEWRQRGFVKNLGSMAIALIRSLALKG
jgi:hypothetical protein